jgi:hypothetical protein
MEQLKFIKHNELKRALLKVQESHFLAPPREPKFRASELPFCPLLYVIDKAGHDPTKPEKIEYESGFYFNMGKAVHSLWQDTAAIALPHGLIGDWECTKVIKEITERNITTTIRCNRVVHFCTHDQAVRYSCPHQRTDCKHLQRYRELALDQDGLSAHTDFLYRGKRNKYDLVDFKTTGTFLFEKPKIAIGHGYFPSIKYFEQISTYAVMLEKEYNIVISTLTIAYVARHRGVHAGEDQRTRALRLFTVKFTDRMRRNRKRNMRRYVKQYKVARRWLDTKPRQRHKITRELFDIRPCHSHKDYHNKMAWAFMSKTPCEHHKSGACYNREMLSTLKELEHAA